MQLDLLTLKQRKLDLDFFVYLNKFHIALLQLNENTFCIDLLDFSHLLELLKTVLFFPLADVIGAELIFEQFWALSQVTAQIDQLILIMV